MKTATPPLRSWLWVPSLYFAEGLPYVIVMTLSVIMYKRLGVSNTDIAFFTAWLYLPWVIKPFWSPFVDIISTKRIWVLTMQWLMALAFGAIAFLLPGEFFFRATLAGFWVAAFLSATHDIAADGLYMLGLDHSAQSFFVGIRTTFYRIAIVTGNGLLVVLAGYLEMVSPDVASAWMWVFVIISATMAALALWHSFTLPRPASDAPAAARDTRTICREFFDTFRTFFQKPGIVSAISFMLLYRLPEAQLLKLISPFLLDSPEAGGLGLTTAQVGLTYGTVGIIGLMAGGIVGGIVASRGGLRRWLMPMAWSMSLTCLTFVYLAYGSDHSLLTVNVCVLIEQIGYGFGATAYTLFLLRFSDGPRSTSHYAMCTGVMALGMMLPAMAAGWIQETIGYGPFFIWTIICCAATIGISAIVKIPR